MNFHSAAIFSLLAVAAASCGGEQGSPSAAESSLQQPAAPAEPAVIQASLPEAVPAAAELTPLVSLPASTWRPFYPGKDEPPLLEVAAFQLEEHAVTNRQYLAFVKANPQWRRSQVKALFADDQYLEPWTEDLAFPPEAAEAPVTNVSWFSARAYAHWIGRRLPTLAEWEAAARAGETQVDGTLEPSFSRRILEWYAQPTPDVPAPVRSGYRTVHGVFDLHGLVWEWVEDYNTALVTGESRGDSSLERELFCGSGSIGSVDPGDYASFMRYALRSSLEAGYCLRNLGFRCALDLKPEKEEVPDCCAEMEVTGGDPLPEDSLWRITAQWQDQSGAERQLSEFRGRPVITSMIFTHCAFACPRTIADLKAIEDALPPELRGEVVWLLVSFDDVRDLPERLTVFAGEQALDTSRWTLLHGDAEAVRVWAAALGVRYKKAVDGSFSHSNRITMTDPTGRVIARWDGLGVAADSIAQEITTMLRDFSAQH